MTFEQIKERYERHCLSLEDVQRLYRDGDEDGDEIVTPLQMVSMLEVDRNRTSDYLEELHKRLADRDELLRITYFALTAHAKLSGDADIAALAKEIDEKAGPFF